MGSPFQLNAEQTEELIATVQSYLKDKTLILVRGIPGLGKSTLGRAMTQRFGGIQIENDMQFMVSGEYIYDPVKLEDAHMATQLEVRNLLVEEAPCVVVTNTFTREWEMSPYRQVAAKFGYRLVVVDLLLCVRENMQKANLYFNATQFLEFLCAANVHSVPADKIRSMYDRYERGDQVVSVHDCTATGTAEPYNGEENGPVTLCHPRCEYKLLDTGYYLALDLAVPEDVNTPHSGIYRQCIHASQQILRTYGVTCGYRMLRKLTIRNAKSHGMAYAMKQQEALTGQPCTNPHANARNAVKLAAGWTRYHITLLSPTEYTQLKRNDNFGQFLMFLADIDFAPLMQATAYTSTTTSTTSTTAVAATAVALGVQRGAVTENAVFPLDALGAAAGLSSGDYSTALYLVLDPTIPTLRALADLRVQFGLGGVSAASAESSTSIAAPVTAEAANSTVCAVPASIEAWQPHITLAFTHNDVRADSTDPETCDKGAGVRRFRELLATALGDPTVDNNASQSNVTDLVVDAPSPSLARMLLYSETQASFRSDQFGFTVVDVKVRRGPMGDDATYRAHPFLQTYLPRGLVYLQHDRTHTIYRGLFSLRKFYGKEGVEDDGIGIGASQLNFKLRKVLESTATLLVMEKVNGRAASCRFFTYGGQLYVVVGTKLSHVVCRVDCEARRLVMPTGGTGLGSEQVQDGADGEGDGEGEEGADITRSATPVSAVADGDGGAAGLGSVNLIVSNVTALQSNLRWERLDEFVRWLGGRTFNGEVLDPLEMHLVVLDRHEWVSLCVTRFVAAQCGDGVHSSGEAATAGAGAGAGTEAEGAEGAEISSQSALQDMFRLAEYTHCVPAYDSYTMATTDSDGNGSDASTSDANGGITGPVVPHTTVSTAVLQRRQAQLEAVTQAVVHARDSEGKVLYFLDPAGRVLELLKFKTWWYIWRRSCRELVSTLFSRFYSASTASKGASNKRTREQDAAETERIAGKIANFERIREQMLRARPEAQASPKFQEKLSSITTQLQQLQGLADRRTQQQQGHEATDYDVSATADELCLRVQRRWPTKFAFFQSELGANYASIVERVLEVAQLFVRWCQARFEVEKNEFHRQFREAYPVVWERFLRECELSDVF